MLGNSCIQQFCPSSWTIFIGVLALTILSVSAPNKTVYNKDNCAPCRICPLQIGENVLQLRTIWSLLITDSRKFGISLKTRRMGVAVKPVVELTQEPDGRLTLSSKSSFKNVSITFKLGEEFDEMTPDGRKVRSIVTVEGNKLIQRQKNEKETETIREFTPDKMTITLKVNDIVCTRTYNYIEE